MPPEGWGRRAAGKIDKKLEDDALFKEIGGQLDADFDYTQWQRSGPGAGGRAMRAMPPKKEIITAQTPFTVGSIHTKGTTDSYSSSSSCHGHGRLPRRITKEDKEAHKKKVEAIKVLQLRIRARRQTIEEYRKRQLELLEANMALRNQIEEEERVAHDEVKKLLRKYDKFRGGITNLNTKFTDELEEAKQDLRQTKIEISKELALVQNNVDTMDSELQEQLTELNILANYKDKEYPVKALRITDLQKEIEQLQLKNDDAENELKLIVNTELEKLRTTQKQIHNHIREKATKEALDTLHPTLEDMAMQNMVMEKEVNFHEENHKSLEESISALKTEVKELLQDPKTNIRLQMFPEFFPPQEKCTPDMDVVLDIPTQQWLPV